MKRAYLYTMGDLDRARRAAEAVYVKANLAAQEKAMREGYAPFVSPEGMQRYYDRIFAEYMAERDE